VKESNIMNRRNTLLTIIAAAIFALCLPGLAAAQSSDAWWAQDQRDRDRDYRDQNRDDRYNNRGRYNYDARTLRDAVRRLRDNTRRLENDVNHNLDRSRLDGSNREDHINADMTDFRRAAERLNSSIGNGRDLNRSANDADALIRSANEMSRELGRFRLEGRTFDDWRNLQTDLHTVADAYDLNYTGGRDNGDYDRRNDNWRRRP
jgi:signal transduction histidine kinase